MGHYLVTGGAGFIGSNLIDKLLTEGHQVICFDNFDYFYNPVAKWKNLEQANKNKNFTLVSGNISDIKDIQKAFSISPVDAVVHLAAQTGVRPSKQNSQLHLNINMLGTVNVLELCKDYNVKKFVFASSSSVYGNNHKIPFSETDRVDRPICSYAATKRSIELMSYTYHYLSGIDVVCIRPFTVYGPRQRLEMAIPLFTKLIYQEKPLAIFGDGSTRRDYIYVDDVVSAIISILGKNHGYEIYNIGTSKTTSVLELINMIENKLGKTSKKIFEPMHIGEAKQTYADISKAQKNFGYSPKFTISEGLDNFIVWFLKDMK